MILYLTMTIHAPHTILNYHVNLTRHISNAKSLDSNFFLFSFRHATKYFKAFIPKKHFPRGLIYYIDSRPTKFLSYTQT